MSGPLTSHNPRVTVLLSVFNGADTLIRCLESLEHQTYQGFCILAINDASSDRSAALLAEWQAKVGPRIQIITNETNLGLTLSLNKGIDATTTEFIARVDADDWWEPTKLEKQVHYLDTHPGCGVVGTNYINHAAAFDRAVVLPESDMAIRKLIFWRNPFAHSAVCYRTDFIRSMGKYNPTVRYAQDYELWVRCFPHTKFYNIQEFLCHRAIGESISTRRQDEQMRLYLRVLREYLPKYRRPLYEYAAMLEPMLVLLTPEWLRRLKRRFL